MPRRPRVITARLVIVSLVVGVVLAVGSVPMCDVVFERLRQGGDDSSRVCWLEQGGHKALVYRYGNGQGVLWWAASGPSDSSRVDRLTRISAGAVESRTDPRPRAIRWPLDVGDREARYTEVGWPLRSASRGRIFAQAPNVVDEWGVRGATVLGRTVSLSTRPIWPGLLGNTLFYAVLVLVPLALLRWRKLRRRATRGLCVACGYESGDGVRVCPECGLANRGS